LITTRFLFVSIRNQAKSRRVIGCFPVGDFFDGETGSPAEAAASSGSSGSGSEAEAAGRELRPPFFSLFPRPTAREKNLLKLPKRGVEVVVAVLLPLLLLLPSAGSRASRCCCCESESGDGARSSAGGLDGDNDDGMWQRCPRGW
jgi:hypothetical protein